MVKPVKLNGYLKDAIPFNTEEVKEVTIRTYGDAKDQVTLKEFDFTLLLQNLTWLDLIKSAADDREPPDAKLLIRLRTADKIYAIPYDILTNQYALDGKGYYANDSVLGLMHRLFMPGSNLGAFNRLVAQAYEENMLYGGGTDDSIKYQFERLNVSGKDYNEWNQQLLVGSSRKPALIAKFYQNDVEKIMGLIEFEDGIMQLFGNIVFMNDKYATQDGITVGLTKDQVIAKLGKPNLQLASCWNYNIGDNLKFKLYFEQDIVKYMVLAQPL